HGAHRPRLPRPGRQGAAAGVRRGTEPPHRTGDGRERRLMQALVGNPAVSAAAVEELIARLDEPSWLADERRAAFRTYEATPFPTARDEQWRYSELKRFTMEGLNLVDGPLSDVVPERITMRAGDSDAEGIQVIKNGKLVERQAKLRESGVVFTDLRTA